jgi:pyruvate dehydrogenase E2 component (dihydrolipoamide acetyltransferase)
MPELVMPRLSDSMEEGTIVRWLVEDGAQVRRGDEIVEIETDKATMTYEADADGPLRIVAAEGDTLPIGATIAQIGEGEASPMEGAAAAAGAGGAVPSAEAAAPEAAAATAGAAEAPSPAPAGAPASSVAAVGDGPAEPPPPAAPGVTMAPPADGPPPEGNGGRVKASPVARRIARERGVDLHGVAGTGPGGRILKADVEAATGATAAATPSAPAATPAASTGAPAPADVATAKGEVTVQEPTRTQQTIARRMAESRATVPDFTLQADVDMEAAVAARASLKAAAPEGQAVPSLNDMVVKACGLALRELPGVNAGYRDGRFELYSRVNVGVAVAAPGALVVPTIFDADRKTLGEIAREARALAAKVREGTITPPEVSGGTFTVSNLGMYGIREFTAVINPPQAAILSVGAVEPRPVVRDGQVVARHTMSVTLACDHRILYGADGAEFLGRVRALLEAPMALAL